MILIRVESEIGNCLCEVNSGGELQYVIDESPANSLFRDIDPYGDTSFNWIQVERLYEDLKNIEKKNLNPGIEEHALIETLKEYCLIIQKKHIYHLNFYGD
jgi:hypothetical protein